MKPIALALLATIATAGCIAGSAVGDVEASIESEYLAELQIAPGQPAGELELRVIETGRSLQVSQLSGFGRFCTTPGIEKPQPLKFRVLGPAPIEKGRFQFSADKKDIHFESEGFLAPDRSEIRGTFSLDGVSTDGSVCEYGPQSFVASGVKVSLSCKTNGIDDHISALDAVNVDCDSARRIAAAAYERRQECGPRLGSCKVLGFKCNTNYNGKEVGCTKGDDRLTRAVVRFKFR